MFFKTLIPLGKKQGPSFLFPPQHANTARAGDPAGTRIQALICPFASKAGANGCPKTAPSCTES